MLENSAFCQAWDRLDVMLTVSEEKKKKGYGWFFVAASTILFRIGIFHFNSNETQLKLIIQHQLNHHQGKKLIR